MSVCAGTKLALKYVNKGKTRLRSFLREYSLNAALSSSPFIVQALDVLFETDDSYVFGQEYAPAGDLFDIIPPQVAQHNNLISCTYEIISSRPAAWLLTHGCGC